MVDLTSDFSTSRAIKSASTFDGTIRQIVDRKAAHDYVVGLGDDVISTGYQNPSFLRAWLDQPGAKPFFVVITQTGYGDVLLPLEIGDKGIATYCGGTHANGNFPVGKKRDIAALNYDQVSQIFASLKDADFKPNAMFLERQHETWQGCKNPFVGPKSAESPNVALSLTLEGGFKGVLERHHGKRKRKRQRSHMRKLETLGAVNIEQHVPCSEVPEVLGAFFEMKAIRFRDAGICDVFAEQSVKDMFAQMFMESCAQEDPRHVLKTLRLDGKPISVIGCTALDGRLTIEFGAFDDKYAIGGPGDLLFYHAIEDACDKGFEIFDFGIGDEFYKRSWCDIETWHKDTIIGVTPAGKAIAVYKNVRNGTVRAVKSNRLIWAGIKKARKHFGWLRKC